MLMDLMTSLIEGDRREYLFLAQIVSHPGYYDLGLDEDAIEDLHSCLLSLVARCRNVFDLLGVGVDDIV